MDDQQEYLYPVEILKSIHLADWPQAKFTPQLSIDHPGDDLVLRPLMKTDFSKGFPLVLSQMTTVGDVTEEQFLQTFNKMQSAGDTYYVTVIENTRLNQIIGAATLLVEQKFIHECAKRARIEDVVVSEDYRGKQLGKLLIATLAALGKQIGCYKISLDCRDTMVEFYSGLGFKREDGNSNFMVVRY